MCFKTHAHLDHFLCFNSAVLPTSFNCFLCIAAQHLPLQQHKLHPELSQYYFCCFYGEDAHVQTPYMNTGVAENLPGYLPGCNRLSQDTPTTSTNRISSEPLYSSTSAISFKFSCLPAITHLKARNCPATSLATGIGKTSRALFITQFTGTSQYKTAVGSYTTFWRTRVSYSFGLLQKQSSVVLTKSTINSADIRTSFCG